MTNNASSNPGHLARDRHKRCVEALDTAFCELVRSASKVGWSEREAALAVIELADNHLMGLAAPEDAMALIEILKRMTS